MARRITGGDGRNRAVIENLRPSVNHGRFPIKRTVGETVEVEADVFTDGHDQVRVLLLYRTAVQRSWREVPMTPLGNDRWTGSFTVEEPGTCRYTVTAWVDRFLSWREELERRVEPDDIRVALAVGARLVQSAVKRAGKKDKARLARWAGRLNAEADIAVLKAQALAPALLRLMLKYADRSKAVQYEPVHEVTVDRERARFGAWYEMFPRSFGGLAGSVEHLAYIRDLGFDIVYLPPIHPVGKSRRKGPNNTLDAGPDDPGSPWAIGSSEGGHKAIHPDLGSLEDFREFVRQAHAHHLEVALDIAFQCSPDHPYVSEHPDWFSWRPDGTVQYAENPPKKYQDIYPFNFETDDWRALWQELYSIFIFWIEQGVKIFRVDNPHTKPFAFWEWVIVEIRRQHPDVIFLSEAFTRPRVMHRLAKLGFTQSYTYFTWRNTKPELIEYATELSRGNGREYFRPNFWPNTPDILHEYLQFGGRPAFITRLVLAATMTANYGIYGPAFELLEAAPREPGSEEYRDSEKYQVRDWNLKHPDSLKDVVARLNRIRRENPALHADWHLRFHEIDNEQLICFSKSSPDLANTIVVIVNLDPHQRQGGWLHLALDELNIREGEAFQMHDLLSGVRFLWHGAHNYLELDPGISPAHVFRLRRHLRTEQDFSYYM